MTTVYLVCGKTGEYSDYVKWNVRGFLTKEEAEKFKQQASAEFTKIRKKHKHYMDIDFGVNKYDPKMQVDYNGVEYWVEELPLGE